MSSPQYPLSLPLSSQTSLGTLTHPNPTTWMLELHNGEDNRLTTQFINDVMVKALDIVEGEWKAPRDKVKPKDRTGGSLIITGKLSQDRFFSNGLDFVRIQGDAGFFPNVFNPWAIRLLTFPLPTIAAINGHAFAAGFILALLCDYRVMTAGRAWACMNENQFGAPLPPAISSVLTTKLPSPSIIRKCALESYRFTAQELLQIGVVDEIAEGGSKGVLDAAVKFAAKVGPMARTNAWGAIKEDIYSNIIEACKQPWAKTPLENHVSKL